MTRGVSRSESRDRKRTGFTTSVRNLILKRDWHRCVICGMRKRDMQIHHRRPRRMGGSDDALTNTPANGITLCAGCHSYIESHRDMGYVNGWILSQYAIPTLASCRTWRGVVWLLADGTSRLVADVPDGAIDAAAPPHVGEFVPDGPTAGPPPDVVLPDPDLGGDGGG